MIYNLDLFKQEELPAAVISLFSQLQIPIHELNLRGGVKDFLQKDVKIKSAGKIADISLVASIDDQVFKESDTNFDYKAVMSEKADYDGLVIFAIELNELTPSQGTLSEITRALNRSFHTVPVVVVFKYGGHIALANSERTRYKQEWREGEKVGRVSMLKDISIEKPHQGHLRIIRSLAIKKLAAYDRRKTITSFDELYSGWLRVFSTNVLNEQFYEDYQKLSVRIIREIYPLQIPSKLKAHQAALNLLNRMMFIYFIQKKGWLMDEPDFLHQFWVDYQDSGQPENSFHEKWLNPVFFSAFNNKGFRSSELLKVLPDKYHLPIIDFPYLNGGLFTRHEEYDNFTLNDEVFQAIFSFLEGYIFTIKEDTPDEINLEINPELLGKMYEGMINATDLDDVDAENGIIYTERPEINFMTRRSMVEVFWKLKDAPGYSSLSGLSREFIYHFIFDSKDNKLEILRRYKPDTDALIELIKGIRACDPACGSGSMLLGFIQLQIELLEALFEYQQQPLNPKEAFYLKKQLISESIYGVDIKEWAVRIAELRLWLYMIADAEFTTEELTQEPLLPNLDFKIRCGNSLLPKLGKLDFDVAKLLSGRDKRSGAGRKLSAFIRDKKKFIRNELPQETYKSMKDREIEAIREFVEALKREKQEQLAKINKSQQQNMFGGSENDLFKDQRKTLEEEIEGFETALQEIKATSELPFSYDIDFMEVFLTEKDPGFDLIIGNPPYVRHEDILPPDDGAYLEHLLEPGNEEEKTKVNKDYKEELNARVYEVYPFLKTKLQTEVDGKKKNIPVYGNKVPGRSDLYVYFQLLAPRYLNSRGSFCFIISNSWMDVDYGGYVQHFLLKHTYVHAIYDCNIRSFNASVNTIIYLHSSLRNTRLKPADYKTLNPQGPSVHFVMNKADYTETAYAPLLIEQEHCTENTFRPNYRIIPKTPQELWEAGYDDEAHSYASDKWGGKYLRAPEIYYSVLQKGEGKLVPLKDMAKVKYGIKTGANDFFIITRKQSDEWGIENQYLVPIIKSSRAVKLLKRTDSNSALVLFQVPDKIENKKSNAYRYINYGNDEDKWDGNAPALRSSCKARKHWYSLGTREIPDIACNYMIDTLMRFFDHGSLVSDNFQELHLYDNKLKNRALLCLNSTLFSLFLNIIGRGNFGDGLMKLQTFEVKKLLTVNPYAIENLDIDSFLKREHKSIFIETGFDPAESIREQTPNPLPDRKALDDVVFDALGLSKEERTEVYWATAELVQERLNKAGSR